ncbi:MAG: adenylyltransferase/cytidyltransferase family protein [Candidatus Omnitrophota bacterium]|nr:adenylyltransferase/cytidyltransferase family protein [Candidatus Omnitrophota bacterium]
MRKKLIIISGGFDPVHIGHIRYIKAAKKLGDELFVIVNSDDFLNRKKGYVFMPNSERQEILKNIKGVDRVIPCIDKDQTVCATLEKIHRRYGAASDLVFAKGGDRAKDNIPEMDTCRKFNIAVAFGVGGGKAQSSSELVKKNNRKRIDR